MPLRRSPRARGTGLPTYCPPRWRLDPPARLRNGSLRWRKVPRLSAQPVRTCVGCRTRTQQGDLLRVVVVEGQLVPDDRRSRSGRGAYVHRTAECVSTAIARKAFGRALRAAGPVDPAGLLAAIEQLTDRDV